MYLIGVAGFAVGSALCAFAQSPTAAGRLPGAPGRRRRPARAGRPRDHPGVVPQGGPCRSDRHLGRDVRHRGGASARSSAASWSSTPGGAGCSRSTCRCARSCSLLGSRIPESRDEDAPRHFDYKGALAGVVALGVVDVPAHLVARPARPRGRGRGRGPRPGRDRAFVVLERRPGAMAPLSMFRSRVFSAANLMTLLVYGALGAVLFFLVLQLQVTAGYDAIAAGAATLPLPVVMLLLSSRASVIAARTGPRLPMTVGPIVCAIGSLLLSGVDEDTSYWTGVFPGLTVFSLGLAMLVSPLTVAVLAAVPGNHAGVASGVNNAVARAGGLLVGGRAAGDRRAVGGGVPRPRRAHRRLPPGAADLRRDAGRRRRGVLVRTARGGPAAGDSAVHSIEERHMQLHDRRQQPARGPDRRRQHLAEADQGDVRGACGLRHPHGQAGLRRLDQPAPHRLEGAAASPTRSRRSSSSPTPPARTPPTRR